MRVPWYLMAKGKGGGGYKTASGPIVSVNDALAAPLRSLVANIDPVQDLHGYDSPWPGGGGKNKFDKSVSPVTGYVSTTGSYISYASGGEMCLVSPLIKAGTYTISKISSTRFRVGLFENQPSGIDMADIDFWTANPQTATQLTITTTADGYLIIFCYNGASESVTIQQISDSLQIEPGSTATAYAPYSNICPISGWTEAKVWRTGKNLLDCRVQTQHDVIGTKNADGSYHIEGTATLTAYPVNFIRIVLKPGVYVFSISNLPSGVSCAYTLDGAWAGSVTQGKTVTLTKERVLSGYIAVTTGTTVNTDITLQLEVGSLPTAYEPYAGNTYTLQLGDTYYGGTLDVTNGVLTVDRAMVNISDLSWSYASNYSYMQTQGLANEVARPESNTTPLDGLLCSAYKTATAQQAGSGNVNATIAGDTYGGLRIKDNAYTDVATWLATAGNEKIVYPLATPIEITLTPTEISTLQGQNTLWADTGDVTVEYLSAGGADPDLMKLAVAFMGRK